MELFIHSSFQGGLAERHRLPAYAGTQSILGEAHADLIILNYLVEGKVRRRRFKQDNFRFELVAQNPGSFESVFQFLADEENLKLAGQAGFGVGVGLTANFIFEMLKHAKNRVVGNRGSELVDSLHEQGRVDEEETERLIDAIEPATRESHNVINHGAGSLIVNVNGDNNVVNFDSNSKAFLWEKVIDNTVVSKIMSISNYDTNHGGGKAFDYDEGRLISFDTDASLDRESVETILWSQRVRGLRRFDNNDPSIAVLFTSLRTNDGRLKKIRIFKARRDFAALA